MSVDYLSNKQRMQDIQSGAWADDHGVYHELVPYGHRKQPPIEVITSFRTSFEKMGQYQQLYQMSDIDADIRRLGGDERALRCLCFTGSWPVYTHRKGNPHSYANPLYTHGVFPGIKDYDHRMEIIKVTRDIPFWNSTRLGKAFGIKPSSVKSFWQNNCEPLGAKAYDMEKWSRTMKLLMDWGFTSVELADAFPYSANTIRKQIHRYAQDFNPPSNPLDQNL